MKGPGFRIDLDVRRIWRCPRCGRIARTIGGVTSQRCRCADDGTWMQLQPPVKRDPYRPPPRDPADRLSDDPDEAMLEQPVDDAREPTGGESSIESVVGSPAGTAATPTPDATEAGGSAPVEESGSVDVVPPIVVPNPQPDPLEEGFGAGVEYPRPPGSPAHAPPTKLA